MVSNDEEDGSFYYKDTYSINEDKDTVEFGEKPQRVAKNVSYEEIEDNVNTNKGKEPNMADKTKKACPDVVNSLIESEFTTFEKSDKEWLSELSEDNINKFRVMEEKIKNKEKEKPLTQKKAIETLKQSFKNEDDFVNILPEAYKEQFEFGLQKYKEEKAKLVETITSNSEVYSEDELDKKDFEELKKLASFVRDNTNDYSAMGAGNYQTNAGGNEEEPLLFNGVEEKEGKE
jgi:hypothetical protein